MAKQTIWREDNRIRRTDGCGYGDFVTDDLIRQHIENHEEHGPLFVAFAQAVLALRAFERLADEA